MKIVFAGVIAREPLGGPTWVWLQYLLGFQRLGHEVVFLEECGEWPYVYDFETMEASEDIDRAAAVIKQFLEPFNLGDRWVVRAGDQCRGIEAEAFLQLCHKADALIVVPTSVWGWRDEYDAIPYRVFLDVDPGFAQLRAQGGDPLIRQALERCNRFFTYGLALASGKTRVPTLGRDWRPTVPPVVLAEWPAQLDAGAERFTTVMQWSADPSPVAGDEVYGQKDEEFRRILDLPRETAQPLEVALTGGPEACLREHGWRTVPGWTVSRDPERYRRYIQSSRAEFSVAKNGYVRSACGWISDRTVCYLASARPALVQETGMSAWLPTGEGLLTFRTREEARIGIERINADYSGQQRAARAIAEQCFDSDRVLARLLEDACA